MVSFARNIRICIRRFILTSLSQLPHLNSQMYSTNAYPLRRVLHEHRMPED
jgi:hypothetical protein